MLSMGLAIAVGLFGVVLLFIERTTHAFNGMGGGFIILGYGLLSMIVLEDNIPMYIGLLGFAICGSLEAFRPWLEKKCEG